MYQDHQKDLHIVFIDLKKTYDRVPREVLWRGLEKKWVWIAYIQAVKGMYCNTKTMVKICRGDTKLFQITMGLHQDSTLNLYLFALVMDELTKHIQWVRNIGRKD